jgi:hypothetical protein
LGPRRPRLEYELAVRLIKEEQARLDEERQIGNASAALVRGLVDAFRTPAPTDETAERDAWVAARLEEIQGSLGALSTRGARRDLDTTLYPLERMLPPSQFPKATAAITRLRIAMDADARPLAELPTAADALRHLDTYLGVTVDPIDLDARLARTATAIAAEIDRRASQGSTSAQPLDSPMPARTDIEAQARSLLLAAGSCPCEKDTRLGCAGPSPERSGVCGTIRALTDAPTGIAALIALHDDVVIARTVVADDVHVRASLLSRPRSEVVDELLDTARTRPIFVLGIALAAEALFGSNSADERLACWRRLGDVPLDIAERECGPRAR